MHKKSSFHRFRPYVLALVAATLFAGGYQFGVIAERNTAPRHSQIRQGGYRYIEPLLGCTIEHPSSRGHPDLRPFRKGLKRVIDAHLADGSAGTIAVYLRDLRTGAAIGMNEQETFSPASLMKVPLMIAVLKKAEHDPALLDRKLRYTGREDSSRFQYRKPDEGLQKGAAYSVDDLLFRTIAYSDNNAALLLADTFGMEILERTLLDLQVPIHPRRPAALVSVRDFTAFFRVLFNASYLNEPLSERALQYLARSTYAAGMRAGIPEKVAVASKFGEYSDGVNQLHEFGIIYYPEHPYLLGIVTKSGTSESLSHVLKEVARTVYEEIVRQHTTGS